MKSLRRSLNKEPPSISTPLSTYPTLSKPVSFAQPAKKVIRCIAPYRAQRPQELSCAVGEILYVIRDVDPSNDQGWYEATNPTNNGRGVVPKACFEELPKSGPPSIQAGPNARLPSGAYNRTSAADPNLRKPAVKHQTFYAIVQYDFQAERPDELEAKAGEPISVVAQSNREWFVAKPIGRLGGPGLIPVSFVEIRDPVTNKAVKDVETLMDKGILPRVEEWKQATAEYKASSIPLGVLDESTEVVKDSPFMPQAPQQPPQPQQQPPYPNYPQPSQQYNQQAPQHQRNQSQAQSFATNHSRAHSRADPEPEVEPPNASDANQEMLPPGTILSATIPSFHFENNEYWFRLDVTYQTGDRYLQMALYRNYDDFYDFQISLLEAFPVEAGRVPDSNQNQGYPTPPPSEENSSRILPYMPGPVSFVDDMITSVRRTELDQYLEELLQLQNAGHGYILKHDLFRRFLHPKSGDEMKEVPPPPPVERTSVAHNAGYGNDAYGQQAEPDYVAEDMGRMHIGGPSSSSDGRPSNDAYDPYQSTGPSRSGYSPPGGNDYDRNSNGGRYSGAEFGAGRSTPGKLGSASPPKGQYARSRVDMDDSRPGSYADNGIPASTTSSFYEPQSASSSHIRQQSYSQNATLSPQHPYPQQGPNAIGGGGSRSARSSAGPNDMTASPNPSEVGSSGGVPPAFLKIKIFHSESDDLIAIRVPPRVTYTQLIAKVRDRLGGAISVLRFRESYDGNKAWREIVGDADLRDWLSKGDKLVLYAD